MFQYLWTNITLPKNDLNQHPKYADSDPVFLNVLRIGVVIVIGVWIVETLAGLSHRFDDIGYALTIFLTISAFVLSHYFNRTSLAKILMFIYIVCYLSSLVILGFVEAAKTGEIYSIASSLQWLPIVYILAFLFLDKRTAILGALAVYMILICMLVLSFTSFFEVGNSELQLIMVNMGLAHSLYIVCMYAVMQLRQRTMRQTVKAQQMEQVANRDALLDIANRRYLQSLMDRYVEESESVSILLIDLDNFKSINDNYGHASGDETLRKVVALIQDSLRTVDTLGRWGGEEFLVLTDLKSEEATVNLANRVRQNVEQGLSQQQPPVTISIGISRYAGKGDIEVDLNRADKALYQAKKSGRNCVVLAEAIS